MVNFWLIFAALMIQSEMLMIPMQFILKPKFSTPVICGIWGMAILEIPIMRELLFTDDSSMLGIALMVGTWLLIITVAYTDSWWKRLLTLALSVVNSVVGEVIVVLGIFLFFPEILKNPTAADVHRLWITLIGVVLYFLLAWIELVIWKRIEMRQNMKGIFVVCLFPITQLLMIIAIEDPLWGGDGAPGPQIVFLIAQICFFIIDIYWLLWVIRQNQRVNDEMELEAILLQRGVEKQRYMDLEQNREAVARIRHDFNNQLDTIRYLMKTDPSAAEEMIDRLLQKLEQREKQEMEE